MVIIDISKRANEGNPLYAYRLARIKEDNFWVVQVGSLKEEPIKILATLVGFETEKEAMAAGIGFMEALHHIKGENNGHTIN
jgi:hypothetical protein